jgi:hypothetical protein
LSGYFLEARVLQPLGQTLPEVRQRLASLIGGT